MQVSRQCLIDERGDTRARDRRAAAVDGCASSVRRGSCRHGGLGVDDSAAASDGDGDVELDGGNLGHRRASPRGPETHSAGTPRGEAVIAAGAWARLCPDRFTGAVRSSDAARCARGGESREADRGARRQRGEERESRPCVPGTADGSLPASRGQSCCPTARNAALTIK